MAKATVRSWTRRYRRGRLETLEYTALRVMHHIQSAAARLPIAPSSLARPVLVRNWLPVVYLVGHLDFWRMVQRTDFGSQERASLYVFVHRHTLADPWECTCVVSADARPSLACEPVVFRSAESPEAQIFARFWRDLAARCELVLGGLD